MRSSVRLRLAAPFFLERYRSGHNEAVLKTVWGQPHKGSNPFLSAINSTVILSELRWIFYCSKTAWNKAFRLFQHIRKPRHRAFLWRGFVRFRRIVAFCAVVIVKQPSNRWITGVFVKLPRKSLNHRVLIILLMRKSAMKCILWTLPLIFPKAGSGFAITIYLRFLVGHNRQNRNSLYWPNPYHA